jgi:hypothetical protein
MREQIKDFNAKVEDLELKCTPPAHLKMDTPISDLYDLPFVTCGNKKTKKGRKFWDCKSTGVLGEPGTYFGDCDLGTEYGRLYLNHLVSKAENPLPLTWIVGGMNNLKDEKRGISVGFLFVIQEFAKIGAQFVQLAQTGELDEIQEKGGNINDTITRKSI